MNWQWIFWCHWFSLPQIRVEKWCDWIIWSICSNRNGAIWKNMTVGHEGHDWRVPKMIMNQASQIRPTGWYADEVWRKAHSIPVDISSNSSFIDFYVQNWSINFRVFQVVLLNRRKKESCWIGISRQQNSGSHIGWKHWKGCHSAKSSWSNLHLLATAISISLKE